MFASPYTASIRPSPSYAYEIGSLLFTCLARSSPSPHRYATVWFASGAPPTDLTQVSSDTWVDVFRSIVASTVNDPFALIAVSAYPSGRPYWAS
ncbi:MAG: hypothetical protein H6738_12175 [Alphaproteobacteria bacterium]|nr:hypothetical protein [Alphaproteobacteria bacterium]